ncbi:MAG: hypothetical protein ACE15C_16455 [Phycisphaerae bacterium]
MIPNREGLFNAYPAEIGVDETGPNKLATCIIKFKLYEELQSSGEWADCAADNFEITGYFYLEKKDGSLNSITIDALKAALGWDGREPFWLQETDLSGHAVQLKLAMEEYNGKRRMKVQYLNPFGSTGTGGVTKAEGAAKTAIRNRLGSKLRALAGPAQKPAEPAAPPNLPPAKPKAPPAPPPPAAEPPAPEPAAAPSPECTMAGAWEEFTKHCSGEKWTQEAVEQEWFRILAELFPGKQPDQLSPAEWAVMRDEGPAKIIPF